MYVSMFSPSPASRQSQPNPCPARQGQRSTLETEVTKLRRRMDERAKAALEEERKTTALARECGNLKTELEAVGAAAYSSTRTKPIAATDCTYDVEGR